MPITRLTFLRSTAILLIVGLVALMGIVGTTIWLAERTQGYVNDVVMIRQGRSAAADLRTALLQVETSQRGFLLTQNESYLAPYQQVHDNLLPSFDRLNKVLIAFPQAREPMERLRATIVDKLGELDQTITLAQQGRGDEALQIVKTNRGQAAMDEARQLLDAIINAADERLVAGVTDQRASASALRIVSIVGALAILAVVGGAVWVALSYTKELAQARLEVEALNSGLEERVSERTAALERANEEIQRYAYIITHDLRAPLVNIMGFTSELEASLGALQAVIDRTHEGEDDPIAEEARRTAKEDLPEAIGFIRSSTRKMDGLINAILKLSRDGRRTLRPETVDLKVLLETASNSIHHQVSEDGGEIDLELGVTTVISDRLSLEQIFGNLLDNAVKYRQKSRPLIVTVRSRQQRDRIEISVQDNGRGIAPQDHERVFELFRRSGTQDQPGEGIGLAHVRSLARNLGGEITLESTLGVGTTFTVSLPRDLRGKVRSTAA